MSSSLLVTARRFSEEFLEPMEMEFLKRHFDELIFAPPEEQAHTSASLMTLKSDDVKVAVVGDDVVDRPALNKLLDLRLIIKWGVGVDSIDSEATAEGGVRLVNTPGLIGREVAEVGVGMMLSLLRRINSISTQVQGLGWPALTTQSMSSKVVGIYGFGDIGSNLARFMSPMSSSVMVFDPAYSSLGADSESEVVFADSLQTLAERADALFVCCPRNGHTLGSVNSDILKSLGADSYIVVLSRGGIVDESAVVQSLASGKLAGAGFDVYETEPPLEDFLQSTLGTNILFGSHNSSNTEQAIRRVNAQIMKHIKTFVEEENQ